MAAEHTSLICNTESAVPCIDFVSSSLSTCSGWPTWTYVDAAFPRNAFTVSGCPRILRRNAVRHLESTFNLIRCQSRSVMPNRCTRWPAQLQLHSAVSVSTAINKIFSFLLTPDLLPFLLVNQGACPCEAGFSKHLTNFAYLRSPQKKLQTNLRNSNFQ